MVLIALAWIPVVQGSRGLYDYLQGVQGYLAPPITAVFFLGLWAPFVAMVQVATFLVIKASTLLLRPPSLRSARPRMMSRSDNMPTGLPASSTTTTA